MASSSTCSSTLASFRARAAISSRVRIAEEFADWASREGATHAFTLVPDVRPSPGYDPEVSFRPQMRKLWKHVSYDVRGVAKRKIGRSATVDATVWMAGFVEMYGEAGSLYPHFHGVVKLDVGEHPLMASVLSTRWGKGASVPALKPVFRRSGSYPDFDLCPLKSLRRWAGYCTKKGPVGNLLMWTHAELLADH